MKQTAQNLLRKIRETCSTHGPGKILSWFLVASLNRSLGLLIRWRKYYLIERSLEGNLPYIPAWIKAEFRMAGPADLDKLGEIANPPHRLTRLFAARLQRGQACLFCLDRGRTAGYIWISFGPERDPNLGLSIHPREDESYGFDLYVLPEYRRMLVGFELVSRWLKYSREAGKRRAIGWVEESNRPMLLMTKLAFGFKPRFRLRSLEFFRSRGLVLRRQTLG